MFCFHARWRDAHVWVFWGKRKRDSFAFTFATLSDLQFASPVWGGLITFFRRCFDGGGIHVGRDTGYPSSGLGIKKVEYAA